MRRRAKVVLCGVVAMVAACERPVQDVAGPGLPSPSARALETPEAGLADYSVQLLPSLPEGTWASAVALNDRGTVVGVGNWLGSIELGCSAFSAAIVWSGGVTRNLHAELALALGLVEDPNLAPCLNGGTMALDVNDAGDVLLISSFTSGDNSHYIWNAGTGFRDAHFSRLGGPISLNNRGEVVGYVDTGFEPSWAAYWNPPSGVRNIDPAEYGSIATDISDDGWIIGCVRGRLAKWRVGQRATVLADACGEGLGILPGVQARPIGAVVRLGVAALGAVRNGVAVPLLWGPAGVVEAGWGVGSASGLNDLGRVVGWGYSAAPRDPRAVTRFRGGAVQWLPSPSANTTSRAYAVNRCGEIAGHAMNAKGRQQAAVWRLKTCDQG